LTSRHVCYQRLVPTTVTVGSTSTERVNVNYTTSRSATVQALTCAATSKRIVTSTSACAKTLTWTNVSFRMVKQAKESVAQSIQRTICCKPTHNGKSFGVVGTVGKGSCGCNEGGRNSHSASSYKAWYFMIFSIHWLF